MVYPVASSHLMSHPRPLQVISAVTCRSRQHWRHPQLLSFHQISWSSQGSEFLPEIILSEFNFRPLGCFPISGLSLLISTDINFTYQWVISTTEQPHPGSSGIRRLSKVLDSSLLHPASSQTWLCLGGCPPLPALSLVFQWASALFPVSTWNAPEDLHLPLCLWRVSALQWRPMNPCSNSSVAMALPTAFWRLLLCTWWGPRMH